MMRLEDAMGNNRCIVAAAEEREGDRLANIMEKLGFDVVKVHRRSQLPALRHRPPEAIVVVDDKSLQGDDLVLAIRGLPLLYKPIVLELVPNEDAKVIGKCVTELEAERRAFRILRVQERFERRQARRANLEPLLQEAPRLQAAE